MADVPPAREHFGETGKIEARKLLERRSWQNNRLLGSFNVDVDNWVDFFTYTEFVDRDGKFQLNMLSTSAFAPLARSMGPMLQGGGLPPRHRPHGPAADREGGRVPPALLQKYINKWLSTAYDLFGKDSSSSAEWFYVWGLKGRYDEAKQPPNPDKAHLNEISREMYRQESRSCSSRSPAAPAGGRSRSRPDMKFHRAIGEYAGKRFSVTGEPLTQEEYDEAPGRGAPQRGERRPSSSPDEGARLDRAARGRSRHAPDELSTVGAEEHTHVDRPRLPSPISIRDTSSPGSTGETVLPWRGDARSLPRLGLRGHAPADDRRRRRRALRAPSSRAFPDVGGARARAARSRCSPRGRGSATTRAPATSASRPEKWSRATAAGSPRIRGPCGSFPVSASTWRPPWRPSPSASARRPRRRT
jgi:hypothetical protein